MTATTPTKPPPSRPIASWPLPALSAQCESCGRKLTDDTSRARGYGPDCWRAQHSQRRQRTTVAAATRTTPGHIPGQTEIDLDEQEDTR